jgi:hypothetical protein
MTSGEALANQVARERKEKAKTLKSGRAPLPTADLTQERRKTSALAKAIRKQG